MPPEVLPHSYKDVVKECNNKRLPTLNKVLLPYVKRLPGFNAYAIEMLISVVQNEIILSNAEAFHCKWASTANWKGSYPYKNFSILFVFYTYFIAIIPILISLSSILFLFSLIRKIEPLFYCCFASIETLFYKQWSILSLFYYTKHQNTP